MIEDKFRKWAESELECGFSKKDMSSALIDDGIAWEWWIDFAKWHREDMVELVRIQIKAILKKKENQ